MTAFTRILAGSDLSEWADLALARAALLAGQHGARLLVLHVADPATIPEASRIGRFGETPQRFLERLIEEVKAALDAKAAVLTGQYGGTIRASVQTGKDFVDIIRRARSEEAALIVLGAHGQHFVRDGQLGTTVERVVRKGDRPVLVVRKKPLVPYRRVLVAVDFSTCGQRALECAMRLAPEAEFHALHVYDLWYEARLRTTGATDRDTAELHREAARDSLDELDKFLAACQVDGAKIQRHVSSGYPGPTIAAEAARLGADLVAVGTHGRSGLLYVLLGSVALHVLRETECDVLVTRPAHAPFGVP
jgi:nucleotide-binding universal stress UspA family protein